jgi:hypothetical protein
MSTALASIMILLSAVLPLERLLSILSGKMDYDRFPPPLYYNSGTGGNLNSDSGRS